MWLGGFFGGLWLGLGGFLGVCGWVWVGFWRFVVGFGWVSGVCGWVWVGFRGLGFCLGNPRMLRDFKNRFKISNFELDGFLK